MPMKELFRNRFSTTEKGLESPLTYSKLYHKKNFDVGLTL